jgi:hypothetical protein
LGPRDRTKASILGRFSASALLVFNQYISCILFLPSDFPQERCPVVLAPLLYPEKRDILMDRILPDSGGVAKTMMESSLADFMQEVGYGFCARLVVRHENLLVTLVLNMM